MLEEQSYIILAVGTDIGKTFLVENLCKKNSNFYAIKPVITGFNGDGTSDSERILNALGLQINKNNLDKISPWRFKKPISPNFLANISQDEIIEFCLKNQFREYFSLLVKINKCIKFTQKQAIMVHHLYIRVIVFKKMIQFLRV